MAEADTTEASTIEARKREEDAKHEAMVEAMGRLMRGEMKRLGNTPILTAAQANKIAQERLKVDPEQVKVLVLYMSSRIKQAAENGLMSLQNPNSGLQAYMSDTTTLAALKELMDSGFEVSHSGCNLIVSWGKAKEMQGLDTHA